MKITISELRDHREVIDDEGWKLVELGKRLGVEVSFLFLKSWLTLDNACHFPFERIYVGSTSRIGPCTHIGYRSIDLGDARDVIAAWNDDAYRKFREDHLNGDIPGPCKFCYGLD